MEIESSRTDDYISDLVQRYSDMVLRLALTYLRNLPDAQDVCQNVFMKIFEQNRVFTDLEHEKAWIIRVTINACKDVLRGGWRNFFLPMDEKTTVLPIQEKENREVVALVLALPIKYRSVIYLHYFENYSTAEIAQLLNRNEATVRTQLRRARELLKMEINGGAANESIH